MACPAACPAPTITIFSIKRFSRTIRDAFGAASYARGCNGQRIGSSTMTVMKTTIVSGTPTLM